MQGAINGLVAWRLNSVQHEEDTNLIHYNNIWIKGHFGASYSQSKRAFQLAIADNFPSVDGWQVVKQKDGNIRFRLVVNSLFSADDERNIISYWASCSGRDIRLEIVDRLPLMSNNKHLSIIDEP